MHRPLVTAVLWISITGCVDLEIDRDKFACSTGGPCNEVNPPLDDAGLPIVKPDANVDDAGVDNNRDATAGEDATPDAQADAAIRDAAIRDAAGPDAGFDSGIQCPAGPSGSWQQLNANGLAARQGHTVAVDWFHDRALIFGGTNPPTNTLTAYSLTDGSVRDIPVTGGPPPARSEHGVAHRNESTMMVIFGGRGENGLLNDTWFFDNNSDSWQEVQPPGPWTPRESIASGLSEGPFFSGGCDGNQTSSETWLYGGGWGEYSPTGPGPRCDAAATAISFNDELIIGGRSGQNVLADVWMNGFDWVQLPDLPDPSFGHTVVWDNANDRALVFGGVAHDGSLLGDVWALYRFPATFTEYCWAKLAPAGPGPSPRQQHAAFIFDGAMYIYGGHDGTAVRDDLWKLSF